QSAGPPARAGHEGGADAGRRGAGAGARRARGPPVRGFLHGHPQRGPGDTDQRGGARCGRGGVDPAAGGGRRRLIRLGNGPTPALTALAASRGSRGRRPEMKPFARWGTGFVVVAVVVAALAAALLFDARATQVQVVPVARARIVQSVVATGRLNAPARIDIGAEVTAVVQEVRVREGDRVPAGGLLIQLSDGEARAALQQAQAALAEARNRAEQQASVAAPMASQAVVQAKGAFDAAEREFQRARDLVARGFYSRQRLDEARRVRDTARSVLESARVQAQANEDKGVERALAMARVEQATAALQVARARLDRLAIVSPVDAIVLARHAEPG